MHGTILVFQQQLKETGQWLAQYQQQQSRAPAPSTNRTTSSQPVVQAEAPAKDCSPLAKGPSNGSSSWQRTPGPGFHREGDTSEDGFLSSPGNGNKASTSSERTGRGSSYINQLSAGMKVQTPPGAVNTLSHSTQMTWTLIMTLKRRKQWAGRVTELGFLPRSEWLGLKCKCTGFSFVILFHLIFIQWHLIWERILSRKLTN